MKFWVLSRVLVLSLFVFLFCGCKANLVNDSVVELGDIVLNNNTIIPLNDFLYRMISENAKPMGIIVDVSFDGEKATMMGLEKSSRSMSGAPRDTTGFDTMFSDIKAFRHGTVETGYTLSGDADGSDNWSVVCDVDKEGALDAKKNYPAYYFVNTYGFYASNLTSKYMNNWYLPSVIQLYNLYTNRAVVQKSLNAVDGFNLESSWYWSSSQAFSNNNGVYGVVFGSGEVSNVYKYCPGGYVLVFHDINVDDFF